MKPYACMPVCLFLALAVVLTRSPSASAFSLYPGSGGGGYGSRGGLGSPSPRAGLLLHEFWRKPLPSTFWRRRRRGGSNTSRGPGSSMAVMSPFMLPWGFAAPRGNNDDDDDDNGSAMRRRMSKLQRLTAKISRSLGPNHVITVGTPSKLHPGPPPPLKSKSKMWTWEKTSGVQHERQDQMSSSPSTDDWPNFQTESNVVVDDADDDIGDDERANDGDFDDVAQEIREAIDVLAESERAEENAELPAGPVPPITLYPATESIPARPSLLQSVAPARRRQQQQQQQQQGGSGGPRERPTLLQTDKMDAAGLVSVVSKAAKLSPPAKAPPKQLPQTRLADDLGLGSWMAPSKNSYQDTSLIGFEPVFLPGSKVSMGMDLSSYGAFLGGQFDDDVSGCTNIETKSCSSDLECSCNGFYHCQQGRCALLSQTNPADLSGSVGDFKDLGLVWMDGPAGVSRKKRQQPPQPPAPAAAAEAMMATSQRSKAGKEEHTVRDRSDTLPKAPRSLTKRKAPAGFPAVQTAPAPATQQAKSVKRRAALRGDSAAQLSGSVVSKTRPAQ